MLGGVARIFPEPPFTSVIVARVVAPWLKTNFLKSAVVFHNQKYFSCRTRIFHANVGGCLVPSPTLLFLRMKLFLLCFIARSKSAALPDGRVQASVGSFVR